MNVLLTKTVYCLQLYGTYSANNLFNRSHRMNQTNPVEKILAKNFSEAIPAKKIPSEKFQAKKSRQKIHMFQDVPQLSLDKEHKFQIL